MWASQIRRGAEKAIVKRCRNGGEWLRNSFCLLPGKLGPACAGCGAANTSPLTLGTSRPRRRSNAALFRTLIFWLKSGSTMALRRVVGPSLHGARSARHDLIDGGDSWNGTTRRRRSTRRGLAKGRAHRRRSHRSGPIPFGGAATPPVRSGVRSRRVLLGRGVWSMTHAAAAGALPGCQSPEPLPRPGRERRAL